MTNFSRQMQNWQKYVEKLIYELYNYFKTTGQEIPRTPPCGGGKGMVYWMRGDFNADIQPL